MMNYECLIRSLEATGGFCQLLSDLDDLVLFRISCHSPDASTVRSHRDALLGRHGLRCSDLQRLLVACGQSSTQAIGSFWYMFWYNCNGWRKDKIVGCQTLSQAMKVPLTFFTARLRASDLHQMGSIVKVKCMS